MVVVVNVINAALELVSQLAVKGSNVVVAVGRLVKAEYAFR